MPALPSAVDELLQPLGITDSFCGTLTLHGKDPVLASCHKLGEATASVLGARAVAAAALWKERTGQNTDLDIRLVDSIHALHATNFVWLNGYKVDIDPTGIPVTGRFKCKDGKWIFFIAGPPYLKLLNGYMKFFDCGNTKASVAREVAKWGSHDLEEALAKIGMPATVPRSAEEWATHPQGAALAAQPAIQLEKIAESDPVPLPSGGTAMEGLKVLDWSHVLAGPTAAKELARYGATTMHVRSPYQLDPLVMALWGNHGKRSCFLDFSRGPGPDRDIQRMHDLLAGADAFVYSWRPAVARRFGFDMDSVLSRGRSKGLVYVDINCYGWGGPWDDRGGFDHNGQMASGFAVSEGSADDPKLSPVGYLNDLLCGHLAAAGAMTALLRRAREGGSWHVKVSLVQAGMWVQRLGLLQPDTYTNKPSVPNTDNFDVALTKVDSPLGEVTYLADPLQYSTMPEADVSGPVSFGRDKPEWW